MNRELIRILLIDDDEDDYIVTRDLLSDVEGMRIELQWISKYDEALKAVIANTHDVYLLDYRLGEKTGLNLLQEAVYSGCSAPIILLTGQGDHELDVAAMKTGAADYLVKGEITPHMLERSIRYAFERSRAEERIFRMAFYDELTKLPNRTLFQDRLQQALANAGRYGRIAAVMFLDLDNFKRVNDTFGHSVGDQLLKAVAERIGHNLRKSDTIARNTASECNITVARLGGDEFTLLLTEISDLEDTIRVAERIQEGLSRPFTLESYEIFISSSIGIALFPSDGENLEALLKNADSAMYHAKSQGKNNYQFYKESMNASALEKLKLENDLRKAVKRNEFFLHYQPQMDVQTGALVGLEALIRWRHEEKGIVSPAEFIPLAEETGLIVPMGEWVIRTACQQGKVWQEAGYPAVPLSINLSSQQFQQQNLVRNVRDILRETGLDPQWLMLEITESIIMQNTDATLFIVHELTGMGLKLIMDDFGTGYSSLSYLKRFPFHAIKIDRSFVKEVTTDSDDAAIARAIISMAHSLKLKVVAEGVETVEQLHFLSEHGCDEMQGFLLSRPVSAEEITAQLIRERDGDTLGKALLDRTGHPAKSTT